MNILKLVGCAGFLLVCFVSKAQHTEERELSTSYRIEAFGSVATDRNTPFWMVSNRYGVVPLDGGNGYMKAGAFHNQSLGKKFSWSAGLDMVVALPRFRNVYIQQLYADLNYRCLRLSIGSKENYTSMVDRWLSSGDLVHSANARPIPEINLSIPSFTIIPLTKGWLQVKGDFAVGRSFDTKYLEWFTTSWPSHSGGYYTQHVLWHHKSLYFRIGDTRNERPFSATIGVQHAAQWGGTSTNSSLGKQPHSLKDFIRVVLGREGGDEASASDKINVLGNHYGAYDLKFSYEKDLWSLHAYWQHFFEDKSGMELANLRDGLWGIEAELKGFRWVRKIVAEYFDTRYQSGPFHFLEGRDRPGRGGGADNYYNNGEYTTGVSYFGRALGSPLITSPAYNTDGYVGFRNNRVTTYHVGLEGTLSEYVDYRALFSVMNSWGTTMAPFLNNKPGISAAVDVIYRHPDLCGWEFKSSVAVDGRSLYGNNVGFGLSVLKRGILKDWRK